MSQRVHLPRCGRDQLRAHLGWVACQPAAFGDQRVLGQHPVHRGHRTQVDALVEQLGIDLQRREIDEPVAGEHLQDPAPFGIGELVDRVGPPVASTPRAWVRWRRVRRRVAVERTIPVNTAARLVETPPAISDT